jgi:hypothetical protein
VVRIEVQEVVLIARRCLLEHRLSVKVPDPAYHRAVSGRLVAARQMRDAILC